MQINHEASLGARVLETENGAHRILPLSVSVQGQRCRLVVGRSEHELPPYRIENRCHHSPALVLLRDVVMLPLCLTSHAPVTCLGCIYKAVDRSKAYSQDASRGGLCAGVRALMCSFSRGMQQGTTGRQSGRDRRQTMPGISPQALTSSASALKTAVLPSET